MDLKDWKLEVEERVLLEKCAQVITEYAEYLHDEHAMSLCNSSYPWNPIAKDRDAINLALHLYKKGYIDKLEFSGKRLVSVGDWEAVWELDLPDFERRLLREEIVLIASSIADRME